MQVFHVSLTLWITPPGDTSLPMFVDRLRDQLMELQQQWDGVITPNVKGNTDTDTCEVALNVKADDITTAPIGAGRAVRFAADRAMPSRRVTIKRITVQSTPPRPATLADLLS
ncbi:hypothetical protein [Micromonospora sp. NPDC005113]